MALNCKRKSGWQGSTPLISTSKGRGNKPFPRPSFLFVYARSDPGSGAAVHCISESGMNRLLAGCGESFSPKRLSRQLADTFAFCVEDGTEMGSIISIWNRLSPVEI